MTRSFERIARRESILKQKFKMFNPETIYTEHLNFHFCLLAKNYSPKLSQVYMWLQFSGTLLFSKYLKEFRSVFQPRFLFLHVANTGAPGGKVFSSACAQHDQTNITPTVQQHKLFPGDQSKHQRTVPHTRAHTR